MQITTAISAKELGLTPFFANALEVALNKEEGDLIIRVETASDVLGNGVFWEGPASRVNEIRNIPARKLAHLVATDGKPRASGMWRVSAMATHPSTDSE
jgi:hypothetical protein